MSKVEKLKLRDIEVLDAISTMSYGSGSGSGSGESEGLFDCPSDECETDDDCDSEKECVSKSCKLFWSYKVCQDKPKPKYREIGTTCSGQLHNCWIVPCRTANLENGKVYTGECRMSTDPQSKCGCMAMKYDPNYPSPFGSGE